MSRVKFKKGFQTKFLYDVKACLRITWFDLADNLEVQPRTLLTWRKEEYTLSKNAMDKCLEMTKRKVVVPLYEILPDYWSVAKAASRGGLVTAKRHGGPGTPDGRRKGGRISQLNRRLNPELYQHCNLRKIVYKPKDSKKLAEFFGIILGDGRISSNQVGVSLNSIDGKEYVRFVVNLFKELFKVTASIYKRKNANCIEITVSSIDLVEFLLKKGLRVGNKVKHQVDVPLWIKDNVEFSKFCLRGLTDTDGCVYEHRHKCHNREYLNIGLEFSNKSIPLLDFASNILSNLDFHPKFSSKGINLYRESEVCRYAKEIGFDNVHHTNRFNRFIKIKSRRRGGRVV